MTVTSSRGALICLGCKGYGLQMTNGRQAGKFQVNCCGMGMKRFENPLAKSVAYPWGSEKLTVVPLPSSL